MEGRGAGSGRSGRPLRVVPVGGSSLGTSRRAGPSVDRTAPPAPAIPAGPPIAVVAAVAVIVFGLLGAIRLVQGGPSSGAPSPGDRPSGAGGAAVDAQDGDLLVVVRPGDSLWSIASDAAPGRDPRPLVAALTDANGGASLQIGQQIVIPGQLLD